MSLLAPLEAYPALSQRRVAALPMYDLPELAWANDALWAAVADRLADAGVDEVPESLSRDGEAAAVLKNPDLLLTQTCGYPLVKQLRNRVQLVATPGYLAHGCEGPFHRSVIVVRTRDRAVNLSDLRGARCALNDEASNTGMNLLRAEIAPLAPDGRFFSQVNITGAHAVSAAQVADGDADVAAIDAVTFALLERLRPQITRRLRILGWSSRSPGLPLVTAKTASPRILAALVEALNGVAADPGLAEVRRELLLDRFHSLAEPHYRSILHLERMAADLGYPRLR
jgi:ABC-type phosphate/phosphonate transport system substrate-binding protein